MAYRCDWYPRDILTMQLDFAEENRVFMLNVLYNPDNTIRQISGEFIEGHLRLEHFKHAVLALDISHSINPAAWLQHARIYNSKQDAFDTLEIPHRLWDTF